MTGLGGLIAASRASGVAHSIKQSDVKPPVSGPLTQTFSNRAGFHYGNSAISDLSRKHRAERKPPESNGFTTNIDAALMDHILHISKRQSKTHGEPYSHTDDRAARFETTESITLGDLRTLSNRPAPLSRVFFDSNTWRCSRTCGSQQSPRRRDHSGDRLLSDLVGLRLADHRQD